MITRRQFVASIAAVPAGLVAAPAVLRAAPSFSWKMQTHANSGILFEEAVYIAQRVANATSNDFQIAVFNPGSVASQSQVLSAVSSSVLECAQVPLDSFSSLYPALAFASAIPFGLNASNHRKWWRTGGGEAIINDVLAAEGVIALACGDYRVRTGGWFKKALKRPSSLWGLKVHVAAGLGKNILERLGAAPVTLSGGEIYPAMQSGTIDAADYLNLTEDRKIGLHEVASNCYIDNWWQPGRMIHLIVNKADWDSLSSAYQSALNAACNAAHMRMLEKFKAADAEAKSALKQQGVNFLRHPASILTKAKRASR